MAKIAQYELPTGGARGSLLDIGRLWRLVLGAVVLLAAFGLGLSLWGWVRARIPAQIGRHFAPVGTGRAPGNNGPVAAAPRLRVFG